MAIGLILTIDTQRPPDVSARKFSDFSKEGFQAVADRWQQQYLPLHFMPFSGVKYGYQRRAHSTRERKRKGARTGEVAKGGRVDLVHTGTLEEQMRRPGVLRVFPTRFTLIKPAGAYVTNRPRRGQPNMHEEITAVTDSEDRQLAKTYESIVAERLNTFRERRTKRI